MVGREEVLGRHPEFLGAGGERFHYIPALNERDDWIAALADLAETHLSGWPTRNRPQAEPLAASASRARALGAPR